MATAKHNDKPLGNIKRVPVEDEINQDPALYPLKSGKLITFPDIFDMPTKQAEQFLRDMDTKARAGRVSEILEDWLSPADYKALDAEYPTLRKVKPVFEAVMAYYESIWGTAGEDNASES